MTETTLLATLLPPRSVTDAVDVRDDLDNILLNIEAQGSVLAVKDGSPVLYPMEMRLLEALETQGLTHGAIVECVSARGHFRELTYFVTDLGRTRCAALRASSS